MAQSRRGCGCALAALGIFTVVVALIVGKFYWPVISEWREKKLPPPSGKELQVHVLDVGQGDAILVVAPSGIITLVDAGDTGRGKRVLEAMKRLNIDHIDYLIATHAHPDHVGGGVEVINGTRVVKVIYNGVPSTHKSYQDFLRAIDEKKVGLEKAAPGQRINLGDGALLTVLAPVEPHFTNQQLRSGGNEPNANSIVVRLDYGDFSMLLPGDAEAQTEQRLMQQSATDLTADVLKVAHHGSKYATSEEFVRRGKFQAAIISTSAENRYGHPGQEVLDRLRAAGVRVYRTDLQGQITVTSRGEGYDIKTQREPTGDLWAGRKAQKDDSARSGFIAYGDFGPPPREPRPKASPTPRAATGR